MASSKKTYTAQEVAEIINDLENRLENAEKQIADLKRNTATKIFVTEQIRLNTEKIGKVFTSFRTQIVEKIKEVMDALKTEDEEDDEEAVQEMESWLDQPFDIKKVLGIRSDDKRKK